MFKLLLIVLVARALQCYASVLPDLEQFAFGLDGSRTDELAVENRECQQKIAIIGSGITGARTAYTLADQYKKQYLPNRLPCITVFERNPLIGGRITEAFVYNDPARAIGTCAATFGIQDTCIAKSAEDAGLPVIPEEIVRPRGGTGVWDGGKIVGFVDEGGFRNPRIWSYFKHLKWDTRYKDLPLRFDENVTTKRLDFTQLLPVPLVVGEPIDGTPGTPPTPTFGRRNLTQELERARLLDDVQSVICDPQERLADFDSDEGQLFFDEALRPGVRERFFTNEDGFNWLELYLGYEDELPTFVEGGNLRIIGRLLKLSGASISVNAEVKKISQVDPVTFPPKYELTIKSVPTGKTSIEEFDSVVIATSLDRGNITFEPAIRDLPGLEQSYKDSVVTLFTTASRLNPEFFNWTGSMPQNILTTRPEDDDDQRPSFFSLTFLREVLSPGNDVQEPKIENLYKLVSREEIPDTTIEQYLIEREDETYTPPISWIYREVLPKSVPVVIPESGEWCRTVLEDFEVMPNIFYAGGGEQVIASAEFGCRMGENAANSILYGYAEDV